MGGEIHSHIMSLNVKEAFVIIKMEIIERVENLFTSVRHIVTVPALLNFTDKNVQNMI